MITTISISRPEDVKQAISLRCANCWPAMSFANALGGQQTPAWQLAHGHTLTELIDHAKEARIDLTGLKSSVHSHPIEETYYYRHATGEITWKELLAEHAQWKKSG